MCEIKVSLFASAIRHKNFAALMKSLESTSVPYEVVFAGPLDVENIDYGQWAKYPNFKYIKTENIKPSQCYEAARRKCSGETISWIADDCEFSEDCYGKAYRFWKKYNHEKVVLSLPTMEDGKVFNMHDHSFRGFDRNSHLMAPVNLMSRKLLDDVGGIDRRFICGQYENSVIMCVYAVGGIVLIYDDVLVTIDHMHKHGYEHDFRSGFGKDREVLETIWGSYGEKLKDGSFLPHEPFEDKDLLIKSQSNNMPTIWS